MDSSCNNEPIESLADKFADPDLEFGPVPLWWWDGDELDNERLTEQLESLAANGIPGVCFISKLPNGPEGDKPDYFSEKWWSHMEHVVSECERLDMELWVHDETYHHSPPTWWEFWQDHILTEATVNENIRGRVLHRESADITGGGNVSLCLPREFEPLSVAAYPRGEDGVLQLKDAVELAVDGRRVEWAADDGNWHIAAVGTRPEGLCYTSTVTVDRYLDMHYEEYVRRLGDKVGDVLVGTFEDELRILDEEVPCDNRVLDRFRKEKDYDPVPELIALFEDAGKATTKLRTDYYDVVTALLEENWFKPLYEWHEEHGLKRSHDNWGRNDIAAGTEQYGDYYRTMRWYQAPGYDDGGPSVIGDRNFFDAKLAASIAACYDRDRVWGELFHSTTWGFRPDSQLAGVVENFCYGCNLYDKHGLYYTTLGGWWEHAPPDVHFRQPYWKEVEKLNDATTRLSQVFSAGTPVVDVALAFPVASMHADWHPEDGIGGLGNSIDEATREMATALYGDGTDLVIADDGSLSQAARDGILEIEGMEIPVLVLPPATAIHADTLETALNLYDSGGLVIAAGRLPTAVIGDIDIDLDSTLETLFGDAYTTAQDGDVSRQIVRENEAGGTAVLTSVDSDFDGILTEHGNRDLLIDAKDIYHAHRSIEGGDVDAYLVFNARDEARTVSIGFRDGDDLERWDPLTGDIESIREFSTEDGYTTVEFNFEPHGFRLIVLEEDDDERVNVIESNIDVAHVYEDTVVGYAESAGDVEVCVSGPDGQRYGRANADTATTMDASNGWEFDLEPSLDNEWADFRYPASDEIIGPEIREFAHRRERPDEDGLEQGWYHASDSLDGWRNVIPTYGPVFWRKVADAEDGPGATPIEAGTEGWEPYEFSEDIGKSGTHPYLMGYMSTVSDSYLISPETEQSAEESPLTYFWTTVSVPETGTYLCHYGQGVESIQLGDREIKSAEQHDSKWHTPSGGNEAGDTVSVRLPAGQTAVLLAVDPGVETYVAVDRTPGTVSDRDMSYTPRIRWFIDDGESNVVFDAYPWDDSPVGWYRFEAPVATQAFSVPVHGDARVWVANEEYSVENGWVQLDGILNEPTPVAVRVEQDHGAYGGAAWSGPVGLATGTVTVNAGDWRDLGFESYSGRARYQRTLSFPEFDDGDRVILELGDVVAAAAVWVNDDYVGATFSRPFALDISDAVQRGKNEVEIEVANTLATHFASETPNDYYEVITSFGDYEELLPEASNEKRFAGGLRGPVTVRIESRVEIDLN